jgi:hypothetical protein
VTFVGHDRLATGLMSAKAGTQDNVPNYVDVELALLST